MSLTFLTNGSITLENNRFRQIRGTEIKRSSPIVFFWLYCKESFYHPSYYWRMKKLNRTFSFYARCYAPKQNCKEDIIFNKDAWLIKKLINYNKFNSLFRNRLLWSKMRHYRQRGHLKKNTKLKTCFVILHCSLIMFCRQFQNEQLVFDSCVHCHNRGGVG